MQRDLSLSIVTTDSDLSLLSVSCSRRQRQQQFLSLATAGGSATVAASRPGTSLLLNQRDSDLLLSFVTLWKAARLFEFAARYLRRGMLSYKVST